MLLVRRLSSHGVCVCVCLCVSRLARAWHASQENPILVAGAHRPAAEQVLALTTLDIYDARTGLFSAIDKRREATTGTRGRGETGRSTIVSVSCWRRKRESLLTPAGLTSQQRWLWCSPHGRKRYRARGRGEGRVSGERFDGGTTIFWPS